VRKVKSDRNHIELSVVHSVYKSELKKVKHPDGSVEKVSVDKMTKQIHVRKWFIKDGITSVEEYVTKDDKISKTRSIVYDKYSGRFYATHHGAAEVMQHLSPPAKDVGFQKN
jgi:hypothetical protein